MAKKTLKRPHELEYNKTKCNLCLEGTFSVVPLTCEVGDKKGTTLPFYVCSNCEFHFCPENFYDYRNANDFGKSSRPSSKGNSRGGDGITPGREYKMTRAAISLYDYVHGHRSCSRVLIYGAGLSKDHEILRMEGAVDQVNFSDIDDFQGSKHFVPLEKVKDYGVVTCCEVLEHFVDMDAAFSSLLGSIGNDGIVACSTNIHDTRVPVPKLVYPYIKGHTAYYTGHGLIQLAKRHGLNVDIRPLDGANTIRGPRKKAVFFFKDPAYYTALSELSSRYWLFPSEHTNSISYYR